MSSSTPTDVNSVNPLVSKIKKYANQGFKSLGLPLAGILVFLMIWSGVANQIDTSLGKFPGPGQVVEQVGSLYGEHKAEREKASSFYERQEKRNKARLEQDPTYEPKKRTYPGNPTYLDQIITSLITVFSGFLLATIIAVPLGIMLGLSTSLNAAFNPVIQILKPVSPLAWLPLITMVVSAVYTSDDPTVPKSFLNSMFTVTLCCLWPTVLNTAVGVASINQDLVNVSKVIRLSPLTHIWKVVIPASIPMIFTGLRLSLAIAWMVLIAAEMLAQNPGLGKFIWDEFQNGSSASLARIMTAVITIGFIGYLLDRTMLQIQRYVSWDKSSATR